MAWRIILFDVPAVIGTISQALNVYFIAILNVIPSPSSLRKRFEWTKLWGTARLNHICTTQHEERFILLHIFNSQMNWTIATSYSIKMTKHFVWSIKGAEFSWKSILVCWRLTKVMPVHLLCSWSDILEVLFFTSCLHIKWNLVKPSSNFQFLWGSKCSHNDTTNGLINEEFSPFPLWNKKGL